MVKILVVEDDVKLNEIICAYLGDNGYECVSCADGEMAMQKLESGEFALVLTDVMMPKVDGFALADCIRSYDKLTPIVFMTARDDIQSKQRGYALGIDDYIVKPFDLSELLMKCGAILRRANIAKNHRLQLGAFVMDSQEHTAYHNNKELPLTVREFDILFKLLSYPKKTFTRSKLMDEFWDYDSSATSRTVDVYMAKIRDKTNNCSEFEIVTVHGLGYKAVIK